jgi:carbonic anhydrase
MEAFASLLAGNDAHVAAVAADLEAVEGGQSPDVVTVCCSDSRVLQDDMWGNRTPGAVFTVSNIGNRATQTTDAGEVASGDVLYPLLHTDTDVAVVVGHSGCGAVTAAYDALRGGDSADPEPDGIQHCVGLLADHLAAGLDALPAGLDRADAVNHLVEYNVDRQVDALRESDDVPEDTTVVGVVYDFQLAWGDERGRIHVVTVDGERDPTAIAAAHPSLADHVTRRWPY